MRFRSTLKYLSAVPIAAGFAWSPLADSAVRSSLTADAPCFKCEESIGQYGSIVHRFMDQGDNWYNGGNLHSNWGFNQCIQYHQQCAPPGGGGGELPGGGDLAAEVEAIAEAGSPAAIHEILRKHPTRVAYVASRHALQVLDCESAPFAHFPIAVVAQSELD